MIDPNIFSEHGTKALFAIPAAIVAWAWKKLNVVDVLNTRVAVLENRIHNLEHKIDLLLERVVKNYK
jgi:hypothetical protein